MSVAEITKVCVSCGCEKSEDDFPWADKKRGFRRRSCRPCYSEIKKVTTRRYNEGHRDQINAAGRAYHEANRDKRNAARMQRHHEIPPEVRKNKRLMASFGITVEQYNEMLARQDGVCAICREPETMIRKGRLLPLHVDHDHDTGAVRGLLCGRCNTGIGMFADDPDRLVAATTYLKEQ